MPNHYSIKLDHYEELYKKHIRADVKCILEIGVFKGGSLERLREIVGGDVVIAAVDCDPRCLVMNKYGYKVFAGDSTDRYFMMDVLAEIPPPDLVIDDGGHRPYQQLRTFKNIFPAMKENSVYCCEDINDTYELRWRLWRRLFPGLQDYAMNMVHRMNTDPLYSVKSIAFYPWMLFITKGTNYFKRIARTGDDCREEIDNI